MEQSVKFKEIVEELRNRGYDAEFHEISKNNILIPGIVINPEIGNTAPVIYDAESANDVIERNALYLSQMKFDVTEITKESILENVRPVACRTDWNEKLLEESESRSIGQTDLSLYFRCMIGDGMTFRVTRQQTEAFEISFEELLEAGIRNSGFKYFGMSEVLEFMDHVPDMCILTSKDSYYGASAICSYYILREIMSEFGCDRMYVIPSSVHEVICVPDRGRDYSNYINGVINDVNCTHVDEVDRLSDHVYLFDGESLMNS